MDFKEFLLAIRGTRKSIPNKVRNSWGAYDAYKWMRKHGWYNIGRPVTEHEFYSILRETNDMLAKEVTLGNTVTLPNSMGKIEVKKGFVGVFMKNGKLINTYPIDWSRTLRLWYEDEEALENKILVRFDDKDEGYYVKYNKHMANYINQCFYAFTPNRFMARGLQYNIKAGIAKDTLW